MCEFIDAENKDVNIFIVGPGWTKTKMHYLILSDKDISKEKYKETMDFLEKRDGTSLKDIYDCIRWLSRQGKKVASGRNFSIVHDPWKGRRRRRLVNELRADGDMYKLRRYKNDFVNHKK